MMTRDDRMLSAAAPLPVEARPDQTGTGLTGNEEPSPFAGQLPDAPLAMPVQRLEHPAGLFSAIAARISAPIGRIQRGH